MRTKIFLETIIDSLIIFCSYILAVFIRYYVLKSAPGINPLSTAYLLIALVYSIIIACMFEHTIYPRWYTHSSSINSMYRVITKNAVGCLVLFTFFYIAGVVYFSRMALLLFGFISSLGLVLKRLIMETAIANKRASGKDPFHVLLIGDGPLAENYISSINDNKQFGINIIGYIGQSGRLQTDAEWFDPVVDCGQVINWLGNSYCDDTLKKLLQENDIDAIVIASEDIDTEGARGIVELAKQQGVRTYLSLQCAPLIRDGVQVRDIGETKLVSLTEDDAVQGSLAIHSLAICTAMLFLIMVIRKFHVGYLETFKISASYRSVLFAIVGLALFMVFRRCFTGKKKANLVRGILTWIICTGCILAYEWIYSPVEIAVNVRTDILLTSCVIVFCCIVFGALEFIGKDDVAFYI